MKPILEAKNLRKSYTIDEKTIPIINNISIKINKGEFIAITGPSGSGKSTLLTLLAGLDKPDKGSIKINSKEITKLKEDELTLIRNKDIGFIFQSFYLIPSLTAYENVFYPLEIKDKKQADSKKVDKLLEKTGMLHRKNSYPSQLSGGEKQRIAICRALVNNPAIIFADEPTGNLDSKNSNEIMKILLDLKKEFDTTLIVVTHEKPIAKQADKIINIVDGKIQ